MSNELDPVVDQWYRHLDKGEMLRVVAVDPVARLVEIQNFDGNIEELEFGAWHDMNITLAEAPEDWTGPYDDVETDNLDSTETAMTSQDWRTPLDSLRTDDESWQDARPNDERVEAEVGSSQKQVQ